MTSASRYLWWKIGNFHVVAIMNDDRFDSTQDDIFRYFNSETAHAGDEYMSTGQLMHGLFAHHVARRGRFLIHAWGDPGEKPTYSWRE